jgi:hypothetical protein
MKIVIVSDVPDNGASAPDDCSNKVNVDSPEVKTTLLGIDTIHVSESAKAMMEADGLSVDDFVSWLLKAANATQ